MPARIVGWPVPEARAFLRDLIEHATQREFVYSHQWRGRRSRDVGQPPDHAPRAALPAEDEPRDVRRTTLAGDAPTAAQIAA